MTTNTCRFIYVNEILTLQHPQEHQTDLTFVRGLQISDGFTMVVYEKIYLEIYMNNHYI